jgi:hypothetical protein
MPQDIVEKILPERMAKDPLKASKKVISDWLCRRINGDKRMGLHVGA